MRVANGWWLGKGGGLYRHITSTGYVVTVLFTYECHCAIYYLKCVLPSTVFMKTIVRDGHVEETQRVY